MGPWSGSIREGVFIIQAQKMCTMPGEGHPGSLPRPGAEYRTPEQGLAGRKGNVSRIATLGLALAAAGLAMGELRASGEGTNSDRYPLLKTDAITCRLFGDVRIREEYFNHVPTSDPTRPIARNGENDYYRFRLRGGEELKFGDQAILTFRLCEEFRNWKKPADGSAYNWPDEVIVDQLNLELRNLFGAPVDLKIGRQDLAYGSGQVIYEGTPEDGSRTRYFDAVKLSIRPDKVTRIDLLGMYNRPRSYLAFHERHRELTGYDSAYNDVTESGAGLYATNATLKQLPFEAYYFYKKESDWVDRLEQPQPRREVHTVGARLMPVIVPDLLTGSLEGAYQLGELGSADCHGYMVDGLLTWRVPAPPTMKPSLSAGVYWLSGDDPDTADDEGWDPLWARYPHHSEMIAITYDADGTARWSNLVMPHADLSITPLKPVTVTAMVAKLQAVQDDGPGEGRDRGMLYTLRADFALFQNKLLPKDRLFAHLLTEVLDPGDYYTENERAYFLRWEVDYEF